MDNNTETHEIWTNQLSNENHQIVVVSDGEIITRRIFNQPTNKQTKKDAILIAASPELLRLLKNTINCQSNHYRHLQYETAFMRNAAIKEAKDYIDSVGL